MKQLSFHKTQAIKRHGGSLAKGKRKSRRPLCTKRVLHMVLASRKTKELRFNFLKERAKVLEILKYQLQKHKVKVHNYSVNSNHMHMALQFESRKQYNSFIRAFTGHLIRTLSLLTGIDLKGLFDLSPFTEVIEWGRQFKNTIKYITKNRINVDGAETVSWREEWSCIKDTHWQRELNLT